MGLVSKTVMVKWNGANKKHYEASGYVYTKIGDEFEVDVNDLTKTTHTKVKCKCDGCGKDLEMEYRQYTHKSEKFGGKYFCDKCASGHPLTIEKRRKTCQEKYGTDNPM